MFFIKIKEGERSQHEKRKFLLSQDHPVVQKISRIQKKNSHRGRIKKYFRKSEFQRIYSI